MVLGMRSFGMSAPMKIVAEHFGFLGPVPPPIEATRAELVDRGVNVSEPFHFGPEGQTPGLDPGRADYNSFVSFSDSDGNGWLIQEVKKRAPGR